jgi:hypothetical protein
MYLKILFWILNNLKFKFAQKIMNYFSSILFVVLSDLQKKSNRNIV